ncbi:MAG TPA: zinc-dependent alcohol dehydrogenase family protein [Drouetiella sp.]|jgi:alcohol dehydrogenase, propanol-preferring
MKATVLTGAKQLPELVETERPKPNEFEVIVRVDACALCRTDLHVLDGDLQNPKYPLILGHEIVGTVEELGKNVDNLRSGDRVGIPWLASTCLKCEFCRSGKENLCDQAKFTGYTANGGFAEYTVADSRFCFQIPKSYDSTHAAPLLCAGLIGWRSLRFTGDAQRIGIYGFGAAAHVITPVALNEGRKVFAFTSPGDKSRQDFATQLGCSWAGGSDETAPDQLDAAIIFAPVGALVPAALKAVRKGGTVVCGGIHMSEIPAFSYDLLWGERTIRSVANLTRADGHEFFKRLSEVQIETHVREFTLPKLTDAINEFRSGKIKGAAVIVPQVR